MQSMPHHLETLIFDQLLFNFSCWCEELFSRAFPTHLSTTKRNKGTGKCREIHPHCFPTFSAPLTIRALVPSREASRVRVCHQGPWVAPSHFSLAAFSEKLPPPVVERYHSTHPRCPPDRVTDRPKPKSEEVGILASLISINIDRPSLSYYKVQEQRFAYRGFCIFCSPQTSRFKFFNSSI